MNIKESHQQLEATRHRLWLHSQYLKIYEDQLALLNRAGPERAAPTDARIRQTRAHLAADSACLEEQTRALVAAIDGLADPRIQAIMVRRYLNNQSFAEIAAAMTYDLRWVYRLHQRGLAAAESA